MKPQDILVILKIVSKSIIDAKWSQRDLANELNLSLGEVNGCLKRLQKSGFLSAEFKPVKYAIKEFLIYGFKYCFPAEMGQPTRGIKTAHAAEFLDKEFVYQDLPPVWPDSEGKDKGYEFKPIYKTIPFAIKSDQQLYRLLVYLDILRSGRVREINLAKERLKIEIDQNVEKNSDE
ncbi:MAG: winged helix-turn-helix transcriptional regulator [Gammaproteobacteria bacterium]|nr:winged helix-turn-helix transcriptional regulator [Gammaproteobacteria bacterium]